MEGLIFQGILGITRGNAKMRLSRACKAFKERFRKEEEYMDFSITIWSFINLAIMIAILVGIFLWARGIMRRLDSLERNVTALQKSDPQEKQNSL